MSDKKSIEQQAAEEHQNQQHQIELGSKQVENAKALQVIDASQNKEIANYTDDRDLANQLHGKLVVFAGVTDLFRSAYIKNLREVRDNKLFKHINIVNESGNITPCGNFRDYCKFALKRSHSSVYEELQNHEVLQDAVDALKDMGVEREDFRLLRKQGGSLLEEVKQAAINNDKDKVLEIIDDLSSKHVKEKEKLTEEKQALQLQVDDAQAKDEANQRFLESKEQKINELEKVVSKSLTPDEEKQRHNQTEKDLKNELECVVAACALDIDRLNMIIEKIFMYDKGTEELRSQPGNQYEYLMGHLVNTSLDNQLYFDVKSMFEPLMVMFKGYTPEEPME